MALALAARRRNAYVFFMVATTALVVSIVNGGLKLLVGRDRPPAVILDPEPLLEVPETSSFPSGHSASSFACALVLSHFAPSLRIPLFLLAALIAISRVYVGVHYPLDIAAGAVLGLLLATALLKLPAALRRLPRAQQPG